MLYPMLEKKHNLATQLNRNCNPFDGVKFTILPVFRAAHWSVAVIVNADTIMTNAEGLQNNKVEADEAIVLTIDPLSLHKPLEVLDCAKYWLKMKANQFMKEKKKMLKAIIQQIDNLNVLQLDCPPQRTDLSCGDRMVLHAERFMMQPTGRITKQQIENNCSDIISESTFPNEDDTVYKLRRALLRRVEEERSVSNKITDLTTTEEDTTFTAATTFTAEASPAETNADSECGTTTAPACETTDATTKEHTYLADASTTKSVSPETI